MRKHGVQRWTEHENAEQYRAITLSTCAHSTCGVDRRGNFRSRKRKTWSQNIEEIQNKDSMHKSIWKTSN